MSLTPNIPTHTKTRIIIQIGDPARTDPSTSTQPELIDLSEKQTGNITPTRTPGHQLVTPPSSGEQSRQSNQIFF